MAVGDILKVQIFYTIGSEETMNVLHFREKTAETDIVPPRQLALAVHARWEADVMPLLSEDVTVPVISSNRVRPTPSIPGIIIPGAAGVNALVGGIEGEPLPSAAAALCSIYSEEVTQRGRGRFYIPGFPEVSGAGGRFALASYTPFDLAMSHVCLDEYGPVAPGTGVWELCVYSRMDVQGYIVKDYVAHTNLATIRSRRAFPGFAA
jgi:hypothetical protein